MFQMKRGCLNSILGCTTCIILGQVCVLLMIFLLHECNGVWCREREADFGARNSVVVSVHHQGQLNFLCWGTEFVSSDAVLGWCGWALSSDLVLLQDAALQHVAVSAWRVTCLSMAAPPLHSVCMDKISLFAMWSTWCLPLLVSLLECECWKVQNTYLLSLGE